MDSAELKKRMEPTHLSTEELKDEVVEKAQGVENPPEPEPDADPRANRRYPFNFEFKDGNGKVWKGKFVSEVPDIRTRTMIGSLQAQLANNVPADALEPGVRRLNLILAHLTFSLVERPKWAEDLGALFDPQLLNAIYEEVAAHEATFLGFDEAPAAG